MKKYNRNTILGFAIALLAIAATVFVLISAGAISLPKKTETMPEVDPEDEAAELRRQYRIFYDENEAINEDYVGNIMFDSGLINVPFVQARSCYKENGEMYRFYTEEGVLVTDAAEYTGNDVYIWTDWKTGQYDYNTNGGSTFMDYRNVLTDQNLIVYGHHFSAWNDPTGTKQFTPLEQLLEEENFDKNRYVTVLLEKEIRRYEIAAVYEFNAANEEDYLDLQYWRTNYNYDDYDANAYDADYYQNYIDTVKEIQLYDTGVEWTVNDQTLTLQTCISGHTGELFEIVILKQISSESY